METIGKIRRRYFVKRESISQISRELRLARNTVKKVIRQEADEPRYRRGAQPMPRLGAYVECLEKMLLADRERPKAQRRTAQRLFEELQLAGYLGAYDSVQRYVRRWNAGRPKPLSVFIPLVFAPGEAYQFDWSHEQVEIAGVLQTVKLAHFRLCYSRMPFVVAYPRETQEMVLDAHVQAFAFWGGATERGIYDNLKAAVDTVYRGKSRQFNRRFLALMSHYLVEPVACTPAAGWEKGQVENQIGNLREWWFTPRPRFPSLAALNEWLRARCLELAQTRFHPEQRDRLIGEVFDSERAALRAITARFDGYVETDCRVSPFSLVGYDRNRYSVDCAYVGQVVTVRAYAGRVVVWAAQQIIAEHARRFGRNQVVYEPWHYLDALRVKPGALRNGAPFQDWNLPKALHSVQTQLLKQPGGDRAFVELLLLARQIDLDTLTVACELALEQHTVNTAIIINLMHRLRHPLPVSPLSAVTLTLTLEPKADCQRYDRLLTQTQPLELNHATA
jgi:transposase